MYQFVPIAVALLLLLVILDVVRSLLTTPIAFLRRVGALKVLSWAGRSSWSGLNALVRLLLGVDVDEYGEALPAVGLGRSIDIGFGHRKEGAHMDSEASMRLHESMVVEQDHRVFDRLGHDALGLQLSVERKLESFADPQLAWQSESLETGFFRALLGKRRDALVITHARLREYRVLIACRPHGTVLYVGWMVVVTPRLANDLQRTARLDIEPDDRSEVGGELDLLDVMDLKAFIGTTRLALNHAIRELSETDTLDTIDPFRELNRVE